MTADDDDDGDELEVDDAARRRLARFVVQRLEALSLSRQDVGAAGGPGIVTMRKIVGAKPGGLRSKTVGKLDKGLALKPGTTRSIVYDGLECDPGAPPYEPDPPPRISAAEKLSNEELVGELLRRLSDRERQSVTAPRQLQRPAGMTEDEFLRSGVAARDATHPDE